MKTGRNLRVIKAEVSVESEESAEPYVSQIATARSGIARSNSQAEAAPTVFIASAINSLKNKKRDVSPMTPYRKNDHTI
jgi:hypothetical protein